MKLQERDPMLYELFELEREKIPRFMRMTDRKKKVLRFLFIIFIVIELLIIMWFPRWYGAVIVYTIQNGEYVVASMTPSGYITAIILGALPILFLLGYCLFAYLFERTAFREASNLSLNMKEDRRLLTRARDADLIRNLHRNDATGLVNVKEEKYEPGYSREEEIDNFFKRGPQ